MSVIDHKCIACGAKLPFNPKTQRWDCEYCASSYSLEELKEYEEEVMKEQKKQELDCYHCPDCGAEIVADSTTTATFCVYCGNTSIMKDKFTGEFNPTKIIPFQTTKEQAIEGFKKIQKRKIFVPKEFEDEKNIQKITGVYIPFWIYDCDSYGDLEIGAQNIKTWSRGDYKYTRMDYYKINRSGNMKFDNVPVDGSSKFDDDMMDSIEPFEYNGLKDFDMSYLSGFLSENYDVCKNYASERMRKRVENTTLEELSSTVGNYTTTTVEYANVSVDIKEVEYMLLPVWLLNINFKNKTYLFAMNGQTGKMVGNIPISIKKMISISLLVFGCLFCILSIINLIT